MIAKRRHLGYTKSTPKRTQYTKKTIHVERRLDCVGVKKSLFEKGYLCLLSYDL